MNQKLSFIQPHLNDEPEAEINAPKHYVEGRTHDEVKDLRKAVWYLERRIKVVEKKNILKD